MVACMDYPKDPLTVIKSLDFTPENVHLVFIGDGNLVESMKSEVNNMGISDRVHFLGLRSDVPELLKGCDVGVLSTKWEGFGLVAAEYMAAGLPVLVTNVEGLREVAGDRDSLFEYQDYKELGEKITRLATDAGYYNEKKEHSSRQAKLFSAETMNKSYLKQYQDILLGICR
ncbi:MAG: glycosyltransferase [Muribaculaceae bacterium]|nr:glycosyltransferase [Muribaculaceae bacterium]